MKSSFITGLLIFYSTITFADQLTLGRGIGTPLGENAIEELSGAFFKNKKLWFVTNDKSRVWRASITGLGSGLSIAVDKDWKIVEGGDFEAITANADLKDKLSRLFLLDESKPSLIEYEFRDDTDVGVPVRTWLLPRKYMRATRFALFRKRTKKLLDKEGLGSEGLTWIPEGHYSLLPRTNKKGILCTRVRCSDMPVNVLDGMFLVAHQKKGYVYAFRLPTNENNRYALLHGVYKTSKGESSGLEYDSESKSLYIWHGGKIDEDNPDGVVNVLETAKLQLKDEKLISTGLYPYPNKKAMQRWPKRNLNLEGIAVDPLTSDVYLVADGEAMPFNLLHVKTVP